MLPAEFWLKLLEPTTLTGIGTLILMVLGFLWQNKKIDNNTTITKDTKKATEEQTEKVESAVKESQNIVSIVADAAAKKVAVASSINAEKVAVTAAKSAETNTMRIDAKLEEIKHSFNGKMDERAQLIYEERISTLERGHEELKQGQSHIINRIDEAMNEIIKQIKNA